MSSFNLKSVCLPLILSMVLLVTSPAASKLDTERFIPLEEVEPGMRAKGLTVFRGTEIEEFDVEIISILKNAWPKRDIILARLSGGPIEEAGVIAGMSGSPVYVDGRLLGAVGYSFGMFPKEPIAGVTPIEQMLELLEREERPPEQAHAGGGEIWRDLLTALVPSGAAEQADAPGRLAELAAARGQSPAAGGLRPVRTPLVLSGFDTRAVSEMTPMLDRLGFIPVQGGGYGGEEDGEIPLEPGAVLGVQLVGGDAAATAIGTLTYREGDRILAFGHSMWQAGQVRAPMTSGYIHLVLQSLYDSYKMGSAVEVVGSLGEDRLQGVRGRIGVEPHLIPFDITVSSSDRSVPQTFHLEVIDDPIFTPQFMRWALGSVIRTASKALGNLTLQADASVELDDGRTLHLTDIYSGLIAIDLLGEEVATALALLMLNPLEQAEITHVKAHVAVEETLRTASIERLHLHQARVRPEEEMTLTIWLRPYLQNPAALAARIAMPADIPDGTYHLLVSDAATALALEVSRATWRFIPTDLDQLLGLLEERERNDEVVITVILPRAGAVVRGEELPLLPPSVLSVMQPELGAGEGGLTAGKVVFKTTLRTDYVVAGSRMIPFIVDRSKP